MPESSRQLQGNGPAALFENAVLAYGPRKAGTTLLQNLLDSEAILVYPAELKLKYFVRRGLEVDGAASKYVGRNRVAIATIPRFDNQGYRDGLAALGSSGARGLKPLIARDLDLVLENLAERSAGRWRWWCAKEVGGNTDGILRWWLDNFDNARIVMIFRDPRMIARAIFNDRRRQNRRLSLRHVYYEIMDPRRVLSRQCAYIDHPKVLPIVYEDLIEDTAAVMRRVAEFLAVPSDPRMTVPTIFGEPVIVATASKASKRVFKEEASWFEGLSRRERMAVRVFSAVAALMPKYRLDYAECLRRIRRRTVMP